MAETGRRLVEDFAEELTPFSEALTTQLIITVRRLVQEMLEFRESNQDDNPAEDEKTYAGVSFRI